MNGPRSAPGNAGHLVLAGLTALGVLVASGEATVAGLYVSDRGVRPLGRAGAFVAGADDLGAIWYNPAGIVDTKTSVLLDGSWVHYSDTFARQALTTSAKGTTYVQSHPAVSGTTPFLPIPTLAGSYRWGREKQYAVAVGVYAPDAALLTYPTTVGNGEAAPQRYSLISLGGSILGGSLVVNEHLRLDAVLSHTFEGSVTVTPEQAAVPLINPVKGNPTQTVSVNGGEYTANLWVLGGGLEYRF